MKFSREIVFPEGVRLKELKKGHLEKKVTKEAKRRRKKQRCFESLSLRTKWREMFSPSLLDCRRPKRGVHCPSLLTRLEPQKSPKTTYKAMESPHCKNTAH